MCFDFTELPPIETSPLPGYPINIRKDGGNWKLQSKTEIDEDGYPKTIGAINENGQGSLKNSTKLGWEIREDWKGQGIMTAVMRLYLEQVSPDSDGFEVKILKSNGASQRVAQKLGFKPYKDDEDCTYFLLKS